MRKLFLHILVAAIMFWFGLGLTKVVNFFFSSAPPLPQTQARRPNVSELGGPDEEKLLDIYRWYGPAQSHHDRAFFERVESDRFILFDWDRNLTREQDIREMESWEKDTVYECDVETIRVLGDRAVVTGRMQAHFANGEYDSWGFIDVCVRSGDSWQILSTTAAD